MYKDMNFSLWCDFLERDFIQNDFVKLIQSGAVNGATSNPTIFQNAFANSNVYKNSTKDIKSKNPKIIYEILATQDIRIAAEKLFKNFVNGDDGFVSIEVDPNLCDNVAESFEEGKNLYSTIGMPNVMIKIPATNAGFETMNELLKRGINVNATLVFSPNQAKNCLDAFENGTLAFTKRFPKANLPKAVISVFVSRFDRMLDENLAKNSLPTAKLGIMNASKIYNLIERKSFSNVKTLFASTGVKDDKLEKSYYVKELLYENAINTAPLDTINSFIKERCELKNSPSDEKIDEFFGNIKCANIDMDKVYQTLLDNAIAAFVKSFDDIMNSFNGM